MTGEELMALASRVAEEWRDDPNVIGVGFGVKHQNGRRVAGPALRFTVRQKYASEEEIRAAGSRPIPAEIEGVPTDVNVVDARATGKLPVGKRGTRIEEPLKGGVSTSVLGSFLPFPEGYGTLGSVCFHNDGRLMALSNAHVWGDDLESDITQPFLPVGEFFEAGVKLLTCGAVISYLAEGKVPSGLTGVLAGAAGAAWIAAAAADVKDPHRRGQEATVPSQPGERTLTETVRFAAEPLSLPLPGTPYQAAVSWDYTRTTDQASYPFAVNEIRTNEHVLIRKQVWTTQPQYSAGRVVEIRALVEATGVTRPDAFHVVAHLAPDQQPERRVTRVLHPAPCEREPSFCVNFNQYPPNSEAEFPFSEQDLTFDADRPGSFRGSSGQVGLQFPRDGLRIEIPRSTRAEVYVLPFNPEPIVLTAYDANGNTLDEASTASTPPPLLVVEGSEDGPIARLRLRGGQSEGLLLQVCLTRLEPDPPPPRASQSRSTFCYRGFYTLDPAEPPGPWSASLSVQTVNTVPPGTRPEIAAQTIGGLESAALASGAACVIVLLLDHVFDVI